MRGVEYDGLAPDNAEMETIMRQYPNGRFSRGEAPTTCLAVGALACP